MYAIFLAFNKKINFFFNLLKEVNVKRAQMFLFLFFFLVKNINSLSLNSVL